MARKRSAAKIAGHSRALVVRPDSLDFRDLMYVPTLVEVPTYRALDEYRKAGVPILDQKSEGACTGFGLAAVVHYLLRTRRRVPDLDAVSPYMLYDMARRYDEWTGEDYEGSSCRGAMKGWNKHGVCAGSLWTTSGSSALSEERVNDAARRPLGAYFRVNHRDLVAMHAAIAEVGVLYASASVHSGWQKVGKDGRIEAVEDNIGGHAFAIVAYDEQGFWIQNSWGKGWGQEGFGHIAYADWLKNGTDAWVARLAVPIELPTRSSTSTTVYGSSTTRAKGYSYNELRPHVISLGNNGRFKPSGNIGTTPELVREIVHNDIPRITQGWKKKRIVLYAHGGLVGEDAALQRVSDYRRSMLDNECYPLSFVWHTDFWSALKDYLEDAISRRRPEGFIDEAKDFMLDRLDDALEPIVRTIGGKTLWEEVKENAWLATTSREGGARCVLDELAKLARDDSYEFHVVGHSAGSIFHAPLVQYLSTRGKIKTGPLKGQTGLGVKIESATLWAPAINVESFFESWAPALDNISRFAVFVLDDKSERDDDCAGIYHKSLLYLVSDAGEKTMRVPLIHPEGEPLLGMKKFIDADPRLTRLFGAKGSADLVVAPNTAPMGSASASRAKRHGDFDDDEATVQATLARILGTAKSSARVSFAASNQRRREERHKLARASRFAFER